MLALIHRRPVVAGSIIALLGVASALGAARILYLWPFSPSMMMWQQQEYPPLSEVAAGQIAELRRLGGLDDNALTVCNLNDNQLEAVLSETRDWYQENSTGWLNNYAAIAGTQSLIRQYESDINNGIDKLTERNDARATLATLKADREMLLVSLRQAALANLPEGIAAQINLLRSQTDVVMPFRVVALSNEQKHDLTAVLTRFHQRMAVAQSDEQRATIEDDYNTELGTAIGGDNLHALDTLKNYQPAASIRVVTAVKKVLPIEGQE